MNMPAHNYTCRHCGGAIRTSNDPATPLGYVHEGTGNSFCDVLGPWDAVTNRGRPGRTEAEPNDPSLFDDPFDAFAVADLQSKGLTREAARTVVDNTYRRDN